MNEIADRCAAAVRDIVRDAAQEAVKPFHVEMKAGFAGIDKGLAGFAGLKKELAEFRVFVRNKP